MSPDRMGCRKWLTLFVLVAILTVVGALLSKLPRNRETVMLPPTVSDIDQTRAAIAGTQTRIAASDTPTVEASATIESDEMQIARLVGDLPGVVEIEFMELVGNDVHGAVHVAAGYNHEQMAAEIMAIARRYIGAFVEFTVILDDGAAVDYRWDHETDTFMITPLRSAALEVAAYACNSVNDLNCDDFVDGGADDHMERCGDEDGLDRDGDGDACEFGRD